MTSLLPKPAPSRRRGWDSLVPYPRQVPNQINANTGGEWTASLPGLLLAPFAE